MIPISDNLVCGYSEDFLGGKPLVFDFAKGVEDAKGQAVALCNDEPKTSRNEESMSDLICETAPHVIVECRPRIACRQMLFPFLGTSFRPLRLPLRLTYHPRLAVGLHHLAS